MPVVVRSISIHDIFAAGAPRLPLLRGGVSIGSMAFPGINLLLA
jgi:hypothetical protein